jgi:hypothetical protein
MRIVSLGLLAAFGLGLAGCANSPENVAIDMQYVGADVSAFGRNPTASAIGNVKHGLGGVQTRCAVVKYDPYGRPYCDAVKYLR